VPVITTTPVSNILATTATSGGNIMDEGSSTVISRGVCWSTGTTPTIADSKTTDGTGAGSFASNMTVLNMATVYYVRAYAANSVGTGYGMAMSFTTLGQVPAVATQTATNINATVATVNGSVNANGLSTVVTFEYGTTTSYGITITASQSPVIGNMITNVSAEITGLTAGKTYHFRVTATNSLGTNYGSDVAFAYTITDVEGNIYNTVTIGNQVWMKENLKTTKYRNGNIIGTTTPATKDVSGESFPKYQWAAGGNESNVSIYGRLYTFSAAIDGRNICPTGWRVPNDAEWTTLTTYLGGASVAGGKLKETGTTHWAFPNSGATNESGFTALPSGYRFFDGIFRPIGLEGYWWSLPETLSLTYIRSVGTDNSGVARIENAFQQGAFSVRCLRD
jgi:uncharacterized protein (TIGR02145 family)